MVKRKWIAIAAIFIIAVTIFSLYPFARAKKPPKPSREITIGVIAPMEGWPIGVEWVFSFAEEKINEFCENLDHEVTFKFDYRYAEGNPDSHQAIVENFNAEGVNLLIGGFFSGQAGASLDYVNEHNMLMFSPSSTAPELAIEDDNLFRLSPDDSVEGGIIAETLWSWGIDAVIVLQENRPYADKLHDAIADEYDGVIYDRIWYTWDWGHPEYILPQLDQAEASASGAIGVHGVDHVGILFIGGGGELQQIATYVDDPPDSHDYTNLQEIIWFGSSMTAMNSEVSTNAPNAEILRFFSPYYATPRNRRWDWFSEQYSLHNPGELTYYAAACWDVAWIYAKAILIAETTDTEAVKSILRVQSGHYFGVTGWCHLNPAGDRHFLDYDIWGCGEVPDTTPHVEWIRYGHYEDYSGEVTWFTDLGISPPGH